MADKENPEECFVCQGKLFEIEDGHFGCDVCKRIWVNNNGDWTSLPRRVKLIKMPEIGDSVDDFLKPIPPEND